MKAIKIIRTNKKILVRFQDKICLQFEFYASTVNKLKIIISSTNKAFNKGYPANTAMCVCSGGLKENVPSRLRHLVFRGRHCLEGSEGEALLDKYIPGHRLRGFQALHHPQFTHCASCLYTFKTHILVCCSSGYTRLPHLVTTFPHHDDDDGILSIWNISPNKTLL